MQNILIVEDEPHIIRVMKLSLEESGYSINVAHNGEQALEKLNDGLPDLLITDINMPRMSGDLLCKKIEVDFPDRQFPILVLTSKTEIEHREWTANMKNTYFLEKPVSIKKLIRMLDSYKNGSGLAA
ncbi:MAG: response regulator [Gammaproteobacteria bacterium]|nr:response regulator [Gammaproteobacteria bacterium]